MRLPCAVIFFLFSFSHAFAEYKAGVTLDSSSNMLMQPGGESGTFVRAYGSIGRSISKKASVSYDTEYAFLQHYEGLQFQNHVVSADYRLISDESFAWSASVSGNFSRFGNVSVLDGYNSCNFISAIKYYVRPTVLLRWGFSLEKKDFLTYDAENYHEAETYLRLDKFFKSRTTLRLQFDSGSRNYRNVKNDPVSRFFDGKILIAQSFTDITGVSMELHASALDPGFSSSDSARIYDQVFLDDKYKYSQKGISLSLTRLLPGRGSMKLSGVFTYRKYHKGALAGYDYLPQNGWTEKKKGVSLTFLYNASFIPDFIHPSYRIYYIDVDASESFLSYDAAGVSATVSLY